MAENPKFVEPENHDKEDVPEVIKEHTGDGPGNLDELPESDFRGYAQDDAEERD